MKMMMSLVFAVSAFLLGAEAFAAETNAYDYEAISVTSTTAVGFSASKLSPSNGPRPKSVFITIETDDVRFRVDGSDPTTTEGHLVLSTAQSFTISGLENLLRFKAIGVDNTCKLKVTYER